MHYNWLWGPTYVHIPWGFNFIFLFCSFFLGYMEDTRVLLMAFWLGLLWFAKFANVTLLQITKTHSLFFKQCNLIHVFFLFLNKLQSFNVWLFLHNTHKWWDCPVDCVVGSSCKNCCSKAASIRLRPSSYSLFFGPRGLVLNATVHWIRKYFHPFLLKRDKILVLRPATVSWNSHTNVCHLFLNLYGSFMIKIFIFEDKLISWEYFISSIALRQLLSNRANICKDFGSSLLSVGHSKGFFMYAAHILKSSP